MSLKAYLYVSATIFAAVMLLHLGRLINGVPVQIGNFAVPAIASWVAAAASAVLLVWAFRLICRVAPPKP